MHDGSDHSKQSALVSLPTQSSALHPWQKQIHRREQTEKRAVMVRLDRCSDRHRGEPKRPNTPDILSVGYACALPPAEGGSWFAYTPRGQTRLPSRHTP